ncbi:DUF456 domain-containing protein [Egibacter rhizosphaerae]|uniref:DUF456 domain-containing protein n=1 Tax=Egibacter rhizosphaerae TaxID=1670831 RepID=A0A411YKK5_9ACTN|nr:DUF456 domain-containing protein [Egibacter rhizosphaerae]QBI21732.1 DUF456 domain-containing protein [Egibacter rhizosphaerae]
MEQLATIAVAIAMALGLAMTVVPVIPGLLIVWLGAAAYGLTVGFGTTGGWLFAAITLCALAGFAASFLLPARGGIAAGAPSGLLLASGLGAVVGAIVLPVLGLPLGGLAGAWLRARLATGQAQEATRVVIGMLRGMGLAALAELAAGSVMVALWIGWVLVG